VRKILSAFALLMALGGCHSFDRHLDSGHIASDHFIDVWVDERPVIRVSVEVLRVRGQDQVIFWRLQNASGQNYVFPDDGIFFKTNAGRAEFECRKMNPTRFRCKDKGQTKGEFHYGVKVVGTPQPPTLDPSIINH